MSDQFAEDVQRDIEQVKVMSRAHAAVTKKATVRDKLYVAKPVKDLTINRKALSALIGADVELFGALCKVTAVNPGKRRITLTVLE